MALIYIVEDDADIREIEMIALRGSGHEVVGFEDGKSFFRKVTEKLPDLCVLDIMLPDMDGYEIVKKLRGNRQTQHLPIICLTAKTSEVDMVRGLEMGADDYIKKPFSVIEFITRVKALLRRSEAGTESKFLRAGDIFLNTEAHTVTVGENNVELTFKEFELLKLLMENAGIVQTRDLIMEKIWKSSYEGETRTVDMHIRTLRQKLGDAGSMIRTVRNVGYVLNEPD